MVFILHWSTISQWMLNPDELNQLSVPERVIPGAFPLTRFRPEDGNTNIGHENIRGAWEENKRGLDLPVAIKPTYIHPRMTAQKSCFTVHGKRQESIPKMVSETILVKFLVNEKYVPTMCHDLTMLGIIHTSVFPEAEFLARELKETATTEMR